jgi:phosphoglycolate phosphatase
MGKAVIFDLDGTLADSKDMLEDVFLQVMKKRLPEGFSKQDFQKYTDKDPKEAIKLLGINKLQLIYYVIKGRKLIRLKRNQLKPISGIEKVLEFLKSNNIGMYVASSNSKLVVDTFLENNNLSTYFIETWGRLGFLSKAKGLNKIITSLKLNKNNLIYIGDEIKDVKSCKQIKLKCISVTWGLNSKLSLEQLNPALVVDSVDQLMKQLKNELEL